jgi:hypothetical protein
MITYVGCTERKRQVAGGGGIGDGGGRAGDGGSLAINIVVGIAPLAAFVLHVRTSTITFLTHIAKSSFLFRIV